MRTIIAQLFTPFKYLLIKNNVKPWFDFVLPFFIGAMASVVVFYFKSSITIFGKEGYVSLITDLLQILTGFYIASLAAVATFPSAMLDQCFDGSPVTLKENRKGVKKPIPLTRRKFLCLLFGYLSLLSMLLYFLGGFSSLISPGVAEKIPQSWHHLVSSGFVFLYTVASAHLFVVTMLGLYYLSYRIHRPPSGNQAN